MLQCVAVCCSVLQCVAVRCNVLQYVAGCCDFDCPTQSQIAYLQSQCTRRASTCYGVLQCDAVCCSVLQRVAMCCSGVTCAAISTAKYNPKWHTCNATAHQQYVLQGVAACCSVLQSATVSCSKALRYVAAYVSYPQSQCARTHHQEEE